MGKFSRFVAQKLVLFILTLGRKSEYQQTAAGAFVGGASGENIELEGDFGTLVAVNVGRGTTARLPCDVTAPNPDDPVLLVLWYKNASVTPVYSYDSRGKLRTVKSDFSNVGHQSQKEIQQQWGDEEVWGLNKPRNKGTSSFIPSTASSSFPGVDSRSKTRAWFDVSTSPAHLLIRDVSGRDEGSYRCKVHFRHSPSWSQRITLTVKDPPSFPRIQSSKGLRLEGPIGPFEDGTEVHLICLTSGVPPPHLSWSSNSISLQPTPAHISESVVKTEVTIVASRKTVDERVTCTASNSSTTSSIAKLGRAVEVILRVNLPPLSVELLKPGPNITGGVESIFKCRVVGASPTTEVQWWLNGRQLSEATNMTRLSRNVSVSTIGLVAEPGDDGTQLVCKSFSTNLPGTVLQDQSLLTVHYVPVAILNVLAGMTPGTGSDMTTSGDSIHQTKLENNLPGEKSSVTVREGISVALTCHIVANPPVYNITWFHNGKPVIADTGSTKSDSRLLRLRGIGPGQKGLYTCVASNAEGDGQSNAVNINIEYAPVCESNAGSREYIVSRGSSITVPCAVRAFPPSVTFRWAKRNYQGPEARLPNVGRPEGTTGHFTLHNIVDDQLELLCWAKNSVGSQKKPCVFYIYAKGRPGPVKNCTVSNHTATGFVVSCNGWVRRGTPLDANYTLLVYNQVGRSTHELTEKMNGNLVPSINNFYNKMTKNNKSRPVGQHHPALTPEEEFGQKKDSEEDPDDDFPISSVLTSLGGLVRNISSATPHFIVGGLQAGKEFAVVVTAINVEGVSPPVALSAFTLQDNAQTVIGLHGNIARLPLNIAISKSESGSASIDKNGHSTLTSNYNNDKNNDKPETKGRSKISGGRFTRGWLFIPPIFLVLAASLISIIMIATIVIFALKRRSARRRKEVENAAAAASVSEDDQEFKKGNIQVTTTNLADIDRSSGVNKLRDTDSSNSDVDSVSGKKQNMSNEATTCYGIFKAETNSSSKIFSDPTDSSSHEYLITSGNTLSPNCNNPNSSSSCTNSTVSTGSSNFRIRNDKPQYNMSGMTSNQGCQGGTLFAPGYDGLSSGRCYLQASTPNLTALSLKELNCNNVGGRTMDMINGTEIKPVIHGTLTRDSSGVRSLNKGLTMMRPLNPNESTPLALLEVDTLTRCNQNMKSGLGIINEPLQHTLPHSSHILPHSTHTALTQMNQNLLPRQDISGMLFPATSLPITSDPLRISMTLASSSEPYYNLSHHPNVSISQRLPTLPQQPQSLFQIPLSQSSVVSSVSSPIAMIFPSGNSNQPPHSSMVSSDHRNTSSFPDKISYPLSTSDSVDSNASALDTDTSNVNNSKVLSPGKSSLKISSNVPLRQNSVTFNIS